MTLGRINIDTGSSRIALGAKLSQPAKSVKTTQIIVIAWRGVRHRESIHEWHEGSNRDT
jgi:hypothetical protein